jgi:hypothetical protein
MEISSDVWVYALIRRVQLAGAHATLARKGDARAGAVLIKTFDPRTRACRLFAQALGPRGEAVWMEPCLSTLEADIDAHIARAARIDPDLWVVEIEDGQGERFITETVERRPG